MKEYTKPEIEITSCDCENIMTLSSMPIQGTDGNAYNEFNYNEVGF
jgi:hypothetical protein